MARVPRSYTSLRKLVRKHGTLYEMLVAHDEIDKAHDRAAAILACANLEYALEAALSAKMPNATEVKDELFYGPNAPLTSFFAKILLGRALKVYGPNTQEDLEAIRLIRNAFAHATIPLSFQTPEIATVCARLHAIQNMAKPPHIHHWPSEKPRDRYTYSIEAIVQALHGFDVNGPPIPLD